MQYRIDTCKWLEYLLRSLGKHIIRLKHFNIFKTVRKSFDKIVLKEAPECNYSFAQLHILGPYSDNAGFFFIHFVVELLPIVWIGKG